MLEGWCGETIVKLFQIITDQVLKVTMNDGAKEWRIIFPYKQTCLSKLKVLFTHMYF